MDSVVSYISALAGQLQGALSWSMYEAGVSAGYSLASGIQSVHIPTPYLTLSFETIDLGIFQFSYPSFGIGWYRSGGLFMGGKGQIIGIGEDNRDEAVLPLEDHKAMSRIGSAIADAGGLGMSEQLIDKMADRIAEAMLMAESARPIEVTNHSVLKLENDEVLAQAVTRGQAKLDYRSNPTPSLAY